MGQISLSFVKYGQMQVLRELVKIVDQKPESILVVRLQTEHCLPAHKHNKAQLLLVFEEIAYQRLLEALDKQIRNYNKLFNETRTQFLAPKLREHVLPLPRLRF